MPELNIVAGGGDEPSLPMRRAIEAALDEVPARGVAALPDLAARLDGQAPDLAAILRSSAVQAPVALYRRQDAAATDQRRRLLREATAANLCLMVAGVLSGLVLASATLQNALGRWTDPTLFWLGVATLAAGALAAMFGHIAHDQGRLGRWLARRGEAELARLEAFRAVAHAAAARGSAVALCGLAVVGRHLLDDQRAWLGERAARHRRSSEWTTIWGGVATALAFVGGSGAVIGSYGQGGTWVAIAGVVGAAVAAYATSRDALHRDRANADRYEKLQAVLDALAIRHDAVVEEIAAGKPEALVAYTEAIAEPLLAEHQQWLESTAQAENVLARLDSRLQELKGPAT
jgi:hypothetical protein